MDFAASHTAFVIAAYAVSFLGLAGLALFVVLRDRKLAREVARLDRQRGRS